MEADLSSVQALALRFAWCDHVARSGGLTLFVLRLQSTAVTSINRLRQRSCKGAALNAWAVRVWRRKQRVRFSFNISCRRARCERVLRLPGMFA